jgi:CRISPR-associated endonuclease/helicase Cas3
VVILDEAQLIPPNLLEPCVDAMNCLTRYYGVSIVLATATQPSLPGLDQQSDIISDSSIVYEQLKRTEINFPKDLNKRTTWEEIAVDLKQFHQVLCVVNTRRDCYDLFRLMPENTVHLSALMCGDHRSETIRRIKEALHLGDSIRVISTQLVEAGVDIDFPIVYRALASLDSIIQAAGRCNREGLLHSVGKLGMVHVFVPPKPSPPGLLRKGEDTTKSLMAEGGIDFINPECFTRFFTEFYGKVNDTGTVFKEWLEKDAGSVQFYFRTASKMFKLIDDSSQPLFVNYKEGSKWMDELRHNGPNRMILRKLQRYTVNISIRYFEKMKSEGMVEELSPGFWGWLGPYDPVFGLDLFGRGWAPEDLCV